MIHSFNALIISVRDRKEKYYVVQYHPSNQRMRHYNIVGMYKHAIVYAVLAVVVGNFPGVDSFQANVPASLAAATKNKERTPAAGYNNARTTVEKQTTSIALVQASKNGNSDINEEKTTVFCQYKDDCFGFLSFLCGVAVGDVVFTTAFVALSLVGALGTRQGLFPPDPKRPSVVDRKIPGVVAALTLVLSSPEVKDSILPVIGSIVNLDLIPDPDPIASSVQLGVGGFSITTAFWNIRWRDRFDYPQEFMDK